MRGRDGETIEFAFWADSDVLKALGKLERPIQKAKLTLLANTCALENNIVRVGEREGGGGCREKCVGGRSSSEPSKPPTHPPYIYYGMT